MDQFADLHDEIGLDDWLISDEEISRKRLIRQTPRHNIYKADWFGDVLIYEPVQISPNIIDQAKLEQAKKQLQSPCQPHQITSHELTFRLRESVMDFGYDKSQHRFKTPNPESFEQSDSAYSSLSSSPQYHTKNNMKSEFEFPAKITESLSSLESMDSFTSSEDLGEEIKVKINGHKSKAQPFTPVILNRDSFIFSSPPETMVYGGKDEIGRKNSDIDEEESSSWQELNELRLIAHENFSLFLGASIVKRNYSEAQTQSFSLVMQMNHPKTISLFNLLHTNKNAASPLDRFFTTRRQCQRPPLNLKSKLNICQQVTNAMTYLHDKGIMHARLTSLNVHLELNQRVKISLIDNDASSLATGYPRGSDTAIKFNLPSLTYLSPEIVKTIKFTKPNSSQTSDCDKIIGQQVEIHVDTNQLTTTADVYSFGTLLFEIFHEKFPFSRDPLGGTESPTIFGLIDYTSLPKSPLDSHLDNWDGNIKISASELIYQIGSGRIATKNLHSSGERSGLSLVKEIISACWSLEPHKRPSFKQLVFD